MKHETSTCRNNFVFGPGRDMPGDAATLQLREKRSECYAKRDAFFACIDEHHPDWVKEVGPWYE